MAHPETSIRQRVLTCDSCAETICVVDATYDGRNLRMTLTYRADPDDDFHTCHRVPPEPRLRVAALNDAQIPGCSWQRSRG